MKERPGQGVPNHTLTQQAEPSLFNVQSFKRSQTKVMPGAACSESSAATGGNQSGSNGSQSQENHENHNQRLVSGPQQIAGSTLTGSRVKQVPVSKRQSGRQDAEALGGSRLAVVKKQEESASPKLRKKQVNAEIKILNQRLGLSGISAVEDLIIQHQLYTGQAAANAGVPDSSITSKQLLKFRDLYENPEIIGQGAFGVVVKVNKIQYLNKQLGKFSNEVGGSSSPNSSKANKNPQTPDAEPLSSSDNKERIVAVKVINKKELDDAGYQVLKNEALILKEMDHPNIVKFNDIYETNEFIFIEMEYIPNGTLKQLMNGMKDAKFGDHEASQIIGGLLAAVKHVHSKNYVHRDLKPENVLIGGTKKLTQRPTNTISIQEQTQQGWNLKQSIKLADFGLSASFRISQAYSLDEKMGTLIYMAPEQSKNQNYGKKIDMWACGIIMYILIEGRHPLYQSGIDNAKTYNEKLLRWNPSKWASDEEAVKNFTPMARDFFTKLCNPMPFERYTSEQALRHPWITRDFGSPIPLTESQKMREVQAENLLRNALNVTFFLSVAQFQRNQAIKKKESQQSTQSSAASSSKRLIMIDENLSLQEYRQRCEDFMNLQDEESKKDLKVQIVESSGNQDYESEILDSTQTPSPIALKFNNKREQLFDFDPQGGLLTKRAGEDSPKKMTLNSSNIQTKKKQSMTKKPTNQPLMNQANAVPTTLAKRQSMSDEIESQNSNQVILTGSSPQMRRKILAMAAKNRTDIIESPQLIGVVNSNSPNRTDRGGVAEEVKIRQFKVSSNQIENIQEFQEAKTEEGSPMVPSSTIGKKNTTFELSLHQMGYLREPPNMAFSEQSLVGGLFTPTMDLKKTDNSDLLPEEFDMHQTFTNNLAHHGGHSLSPNPRKPMSKNQHRRVIPAGQGSNSITGALGQQFNDFSNLTQMLHTQAKSKSQLGHNVVGEETTKKKKRTLNSKRRVIDSKKQESSNVFEGDLEGIINLTYLQQAGVSQINQILSYPVQSNSFMSEERPNLSQSPVKVKSVLQNPSRYQNNPNSILLPKLVQPNMINQDLNQSEQPPLTQRRLGDNNDWSASGIGLPQGPHSHQATSYNGFRRSLVGLAPQNQSLSKVNQKSLETLHNEAISLNGGAGQRTHNYFYNNRPNNLHGPLPAAQQIDQILNQGAAKMNAKSQNTNVTSLNDGVGSGSGSGNNKGGGDEAFNMMMLHSQTSQNMVSQNNLEFISFQQKYNQWKQRKAAGLAGVSPQKGSVTSKGKHFSHLINAEGQGPAEEDFYAVGGVGSGDDEFLQGMVFAGATQHFLGQQRSSATIIPLGAQNPLFQHQHTSLSDVVPSNAFSHPDNTNLLSQVLTGQGPSGTLEINKHSNIHMMTRTPIIRNSVLKNSKLGTDFRNEELVRMMLMAHRQSEDTSFVQALSTAKVMQSLNYASNQGKYKYAPGMETSPTKNSSSKTKRRMGKKSAQNESQMMIVGNSNAVALMAAEHQPPIALGNLQNLNYQMISPNKKNSPSKK